MIAAISWVPKGASKSVPALADPPSKQEIEEILKSDAFKIHNVNENDEEYHNMDFDASKQDDEVFNALAVADALGKASNGSKLETDGLTDALKELVMDNYDEEDDGVELFGSGLGNLYYPSNDMDPYLKNQNDDDSEEEEDITKIQRMQSLFVLVMRMMPAILRHVTEVWIIEDPTAGDINMYVHHDIVIPAFPLCTTWFDCPIKGGENGNLIAVGSMEPAIEIWDLDIMDAVQPSAVLGGIIEKKKAKKKSVKYKAGSHTDSVLGLAWNKEYRNILASASADKLVKIWDVATEKCDITIDHHTDKVQAVAWNHFTPQVLLSGSFDHSLVMTAEYPLMVDLSGQLRLLLRAWHGIHTLSIPLWFVLHPRSIPTNLLLDSHILKSISAIVSLENGMVHGFDVRAASSELSSEPKPTFTLHAHEKAVCAISYNPAVPNLLATGSMDKMVKLWDLSNQPSCIASKNPKAGAVFSISFSEDCPFSLAIGGSKGTLQMWDLLSDFVVAGRYGKYANQHKHPPS